jgi:hypothetical protein
MSAALKQNADLDRRKFLQLHIYWMLEQAVQIFTTMLEIILTQKHLILMESGCL